MTPRKPKSAPSGTSASRGKKAAKASKPPQAVEPEVLPAESTRTKGEVADFDEEEVEHDEPSPEDLAESAPALAVPALDVEPELGAVSPTDPLRRDLDELRRYPILSPEDEFRLAQRLHGHGDLEAAKLLVSANLRLVVKIAFEYRTIYSNMLDLIQEGNIGLMKAVSKFDPTKGARLGYYASWWIRSYILKYILDNFRLVKIGTTQAQKKLFYHLVREKERLEAQGLLAGPKLLAEKLHVREKDVVEMEQRLSGRGAEMSIDAPLDRESDLSGPTHAILLPDESEGADEVLARQELLRLLEDQLPSFEKELNEKERRLLRDRLLAEEPKTLQEVADLYGLTRERARQIESKVISKLREFLRPSLEPDRMKKRPQD